MIASYLEMGAVGRAARHAASSARPKASPTPISKKPSSAPRPAMPHRSDRPAPARHPSSLAQEQGTEEFTAKQREVAGCSTGAGRYGRGSAQIEHFWAGALRRAVIDGDVENGSLMAGQSVGMVKAEEPAADIIARRLMRRV